MFGPEFIEQLKQLKAASDQGMEKLPDILVEGTSGSGLVRLKLDGTYALKELKIAAEIKHMELEDLEDFLALALQDAVSKVTALREQEMINTILGK